MISARGYYEIVVLPTVSMFSSHNKDIGLALLSCMASLHVVDYVMQNREADIETANDMVSAYCRTAAERSFPFCVVRAFALASKHCRLSKESLKGFHSGNYMIAYPSFAGVARCGATFMGDTVGGVTIHWKGTQFVNLSNALKLTLEFYEKEFPELMHAAGPVS
jgi:hypothetical protein